MDVPCSSFLSYFAIVFLTLTFVCAEESVGKNNTDLGGINFKYLLVSLNSSASLICGGEGGNVSWTSPLLTTLVSHSQNTTRTVIDENGTLTISEIVAADGGFYWCTRNNDLSTASVWHVMIDPWFRHHLEMDSITYGWYAGLGMLFLGLTVGVMKVIVRLCCPRCHARASAAARVQQMRTLIVGLETYRHEQSTKLWEHYNSQVTKLKESCAVQMEGLRDHYGTKITRFSNYRLPLGNFREQYSQQVGRIRDYSTVQMERLQDNYAKNLGRLRTYSVVQLERFRQQYQLQHKHMAKILEAMNFNIENCRSGGEMTPGDSMDLNLNMDLSLANMPMDPSDVRRESSDSITIDPAMMAITVQVGMERERTGDDLSSLNYVTPPSGATPVLEHESEVLNAGDARFKVLETLTDPGQNGRGDDVMVQRETSV